MVHRDPGVRSPAQGALHAQDVLFVEVDDLFDLEAQIFDDLSEIIPPPCETRVPLIDCLPSANQTDGARDGNRASARPRIDV